MKYTVKYRGKVLGRVIVDGGRTDEELCKFAGVDLARTEEEYENAVENGKYILEDLDIIQE